MSDGTLRAAAALATEPAGTCTGPGPRQENAGPGDAAFFEQYRWCLNPLLTAGAVLQRLREEVERYGSIDVTWQREEVFVNVYLLISAAMCTADDYLGRRRWNLGAIGRRFPVLRRWVSILEKALNFAWSAPAWLGDRRVRRWRKLCTSPLERISDLLAKNVEPGAEQWTDIAAELTRLAGARLPEGLLECRLRVPEAYRCQDMSHFDAIRMARRFAESQTRRGPLAIVGLRTAGAYFAPLVAAFLRSEKWPAVEWMTIRPKLGVSRQERRRLRGLLDRGAEVVLVDDHPNTGGTLKLTLELLGGFGVKPESVVAIVPSHPAQPAWSIPGLRMYTVAPKEFYKSRMLSDAALASVLPQFYPDALSVEIWESPAVEAINSQLAEHSGDGFHVRLKRLIRVKLVPRDGPPQSNYVFAKSAGWGWLGYHAYLAGERLAGFVPHVLGLRNGILFSEWVGTPGEASPSLPGGPPVELLARYVASRAKALPLEADPCFENPDGRLSCWMALTILLRRAYGPYLGRLKHPALRKCLRSYLTPAPAVADGKMGPSEWIRSGQEFVKVDFEHHNFGGGELNMADPAYDLASAVFEFRLTPRDERSLLEAYSSATADRDVSRRVWLYKILYGVRAITGAAYFMSRRSSRARQEELNLRYLSARSFLTWQMLEYCRALAGPQRQAEWTDRLFFLDLDGVLDREWMRFPHTTPSGLEALNLLRASGFSVILNSGRSVEDVRRYCEAHSLPGGCAEFGSVLVDAVEGQEVPLCDGRAAEEFERCREALRSLPGVFTDPGYHHSVRAYRYAGEAWRGLRHEEVAEILERTGCRDLAAIERDADTYFVWKGCDKGAGVVAALAHLPGSRAIAGMGDSEHDIPMLSRVAMPYAPANCSPKVRREAASFGCRIMSQRFQRALLAAARDLVRRTRGTQGVESLKLGPAAGADDLIWKVLNVAERSTTRQLFGVLDFRNL